jgi:hypothetical protein
MEDQEEEENLLFCINATMWVVHGKSQGDFKSFELWGQRIKSPRLKRRGQQEQLLQKRRAAKLQL